MIQIFEYVILPGYKNCYVIIDGYYVLFYGDSYYKDHVKEVIDAIINNTFYISSSDYRFTSSTGSGKSTLLAEFKDADDVNKHYKFELAEHLI